MATKLDRSTLIRFARSVGRVRGEWVAIDGSKFRAVSSAHDVREREAVKRYLDQLAVADEQDEVVIDPSAVVAALEIKESSGAGSGVYAHGERPRAGLQRADCRRC